MGPKRADATADAGAGPRKEVDGQALAASLAVSLLELGITLTASYFFSKWIARMVQGGGGHGPGDGDMEFSADNGSGNRGGAAGVVARLRALLETRHGATLRAMADELEEHVALRQEEKKDEDDRGEGGGGGNPTASDDDDGAPAELQYARYEEELNLRHEESLAALEALTPYEMNVAQNNVIDPSNLAVRFADVGGMDDIKSEIYDLVVLPLLRPDLFVSDSGLVAPPKGILLYG